jgi:hypothetical protein
VVVAVIAGLVLVQRVATTYRDGLDVAADSAALAVDASEPIESIADDLVAFARAAETGIADARAIVASAQVSVAQLGAAAQDELAETTEGVASLADRTAGVIESIERFIPGDRQSAAEDLRRIADGLEPVPDELRALGVQLEQTAAELAAADPTLATLETTVASLGDDLAAMAPTIDDLAATADLLAARVDDARSRVGLDLWLARLVIVLVGAVLAIALVLIETRTSPRPGAGEPTD